MEVNRTIGHLALHYGPGDCDGARRLLEVLGATLVENGPPGFCTVLIDGETANHAQNIMFLSQCSNTQLQLEAAITTALHAGGSDQAPELTEYRQMRYDKPESIAHIGIRYKTLEEVEQAILTLEKGAQPGGEFEGRIEVTKFKARPDLDPAIDARMAVSPIFDESTKPAFANYWVQCFVKTDLFAHGLLAFGQTIELDYVFDGFFAEEPWFGPPRK